MGCSANACNAIGESSGGEVPAPEADKLSVTSFDDLVIVMFTNFRPNWSEWL